MSRLLVFGGSGVIGRGVLKAASADPAVTETSALQRRPVFPPLPGVACGKVNDFADLGGWDDAFAAADAVIFALGISQNAVAEDEYRRITLAYPMEAARRLADANPRAAFVFVSGQGADPSGRSRLLFGRVKGEAENGLGDIPLGRLVVARPAAVVPKEWPRRPTVVERVYVPVMRMLEPVLPGLVISSADLGRALVGAAVDPSITGILKNEALRDLGRGHSAGIDRSRPAQRA